MGCKRSAYTSSEVVDERIYERCIMEASPCEGGAYGEARGHWVHVEERPPSHPFSEREVLMMGTIT